MQRKEFEYTTNICQEAREKNRLTVTVDDVTELAQRINGRLAERRLQLLNNKIPALAAAP